MNQNLETFNAALQIAQQAVIWLVKWVDPKLASKFSQPTSSNAVERAKKILSWPDKANFQPLRLLFDQVKLSQCQDKVHYWLPKSIENQYPIIPYPYREKPNDNDFNVLKSEIRDAVDLLREEDWKNLSLLILFLEKFGSFIGFVEPEISLIDVVKSTAAVAAALVDNPTEEICLISSDLSGIQDFIYTISSDGALKSLRARSFYLEIVTEEVVQQLLAAFRLPRTSIIYTGAGKSYLLAAYNKETKDKVKQIQQMFNKWLYDKFQGKVFLSLDLVGFPASEVANPEFSQYWGILGDLLNKQKQRKFHDQIQKFLTCRHSYRTRCQVCHRDDTKNLKPLKQFDDEDDHKDDDETEESEILEEFNENSEHVLACPTCRQMFRLGDALFNLGLIVRSPQKDDNAADYLKFEFSYESLNSCYYYNLYEYHRVIVNNSETAFLINNWRLKDYQFGYFRNGATPLLLGNYGKQNEEEARFIRAEEMVEAAEKSGAIPRVGYLRMDVDRLGQIFAKGLAENNTLFLPKIAGLSRQMSYFFKVYLNSLAKNRHKNFVQYCQNETKKEKVLPKFDSLTHKDRDNLLFIYAGGDDVFISGAWNEVVEFAFDVYQCFRAYTGHNPDITISGGISIDEFKFPIYQSADESGDAEKAAKLNGKDSLGLFGQVFKWAEWLEIQDINLIDPEIKSYLHSETKPTLLGVLPFVKKLEEHKIGVSYSRNFVRNLLITAQIQEEALKKFNDKKSEDALGTRYYLHLPKIAYTLARLPKDVLNDDAFRTSLKSPYNAPYFRAIATWIELLNRSS